MRAAQFAARFGFSVAEQTLELCRKMDVSALAKERVFEELKKALLSAEKPSVFFEVLRNAGALGVWFPELYALIGVEQNVKHHSEGDVWVHTMMVLDEAAKRRASAKKPLVFMLAALTHDFGKAVCTQNIDGEIHAYGHETEGLPIIKNFLDRITNENAVIKYVLNLAELHMRPNVLAGQKSSVKATNKMFDASICPKDLIFIAMADHLGRISLGESTSNDEFLFERLDIFNKTMEKPYVQGRDLIEAGLAPGENFGKLLDHAHKLRVSGVEKTEALKATLAFSRNKKK
jgi:tRNA nucleotidyltransferase (CCA-adding enzyme)